MAHTVYPRAPARERQPARRDHLCAVSINNSHTLGPWSTFLAVPNRKSRSRFHYNNDNSDLGEPWHITVDLGNRKTWDNGNGFLRKTYHIYAKNNDLSQGYAGYSSSVYTTGTRKYNPRFQLPPRTKGDTPFWPLGARDYYRNPFHRKALHEATQRTFEPPTLSQYPKTEDSWGLRFNPAMRAFEKVPVPRVLAVQNALDDLINSIREGASKPVLRPKGVPFQVQDNSGNWVHISQAVSTAISEGKEVPPVWQFLLKEFRAKTPNASKRLKFQRASGAQAPSGFSRVARDKLGRTRGIIRPQRRRQLPSSRYKGPYVSDASSSQQPKMPGPVDEGPGSRGGDLRAAYHIFRRDTSSTGREDKKSNLPSLSRGPSRLAAHQRLEKSEATVRASCNKLTISHMLEKDTGVRRGGSASQKLASKASHEETLAASSNERKPEATTRSRKVSRHPRITAVKFNLGTALLDAAPKPVGISNQRRVPNARTPAPDKASSRPRTEGPQTSSLANLLLEFGDPDPRASGPSGLRQLTSPRPRNTKGGKPGPWTRASGQRKSGQSSRSISESAAFGCSLEFRTATLPP
jgi:hypothetical protein